MTKTIVVPVNHECLLLNSSRKMVGLAQNKAQLSIKQKRPLNKKSRSLGFTMLVGAARFELTTSSTPRKRATELRYAPTDKKYYTA
jgi:hypothetical protein